MRALRALWTFFGSSDRIDFEGNLGKIIPPEGMKHDEENNEADADCGAADGTALCMLHSAGEHSDAGGFGPGAGEYYGRNYPWTLVFQGY